MVNSESPVDLVVIQSPHEYRDGHCMGEKKESMRVLGDMCRTYDIPVRVPGGNEPISRSRSPSHMHQDSWVRTFFGGCDYLGKFSPDMLKQGGNSERIRILLTGGSCKYDNRNDLSEIVTTAGLPPDTVENFDPQDEKRDIAIVGFCIPGQAQILERIIVSMGREPVIYIDPRSAICDLNHNGVYLVQDTTILVGYPMKPSIIRRVPRNMIFSEG